MNYRVEYVEERPVVQESAWALVINGRSWVTLLCTPEKLDYLVLGFLASEGLISELEDVVALRSAPHGVEIRPGVGSAPSTLPSVAGQALSGAEGNAIHVQLRREDVRLPRRRTVTSGCIGGVTFDDLAGNFRPLNTHQTITPRQVFELMEAMRAGAIMYQETRGLHCSALADQDGILVLAEDIGRHNTLDKIWGECLVRGIRTNKRFLLTTGRLSSEMLYKAVKMGTPIVVSRSSPSDLSLRLARRWGMTLIGYVRGRHMRIYSGRERVVTDVGQVANLSYDMESLIPCDT